jgi:hypothetical protein
MAHGAAAHAAMVARATKASGVIVRVAPGDFFELLRRAESPLVVVAEGGIFRKHFRYLTSYRGLAFFTKSDQPLSLPRGCETVVAEKIWIPD